MRNISITIFTSIFLFFSCQVVAKEGRASLWMVMPFAKAISNCSRYGPELRQRLTEALAIGKKNTKEKLPVNIWKLLEDANSSTQNNEANSSIEKNCNEVIKMYQHPQFATHFRQAIVAQLVSSPALQCIIKQPSTSNKVKEAWLQAFVRNGLELSENSINEAVENAREYINNMKTIDGPSISDCEKITGLFSSKAFDAKYGEKGFYDFFLTN